MLKQVGKRFEKGGRGIVIIWGTGGKKGSGGCLLYWKKLERGKRCLTSMKATQLTNEKGDWGGALPGMTQQERDLRVGKNDGKSSEKRRILDKSGGGRTKILAKERGKNQDF